jgi:hypothetical protein
MSRRVAILVLVALAACGQGADDPPEDAAMPDRSGEVPADVQSFLDRVADDPASLPLDLTYDLLNKNGGGEHEVGVTSPPLAVTVDGEPVDLADDTTLGGYGIFSGFLAANPAAAIEANARRADADPAVFSERDGMDCIAIPVAGSATSTWCLTGDGIFGYVDSPSVRYELRP